MGWVTVDCPGTRIVLIDDKTQGPNRDAAGELNVLMIDDGLHTFALDGGNCTPPTQDLLVRYTSAQAPLRVLFT